MTSINPRHRGQHAPRSRVLVVHQAAELYGSDRSLLDLLAGLDRSRLEPIVCVPQSGPLVDRLRALAIEVQVAPLLKVRRGTLLAPWRLVRLVGEIRRALREIDTLVNGRGIDCVYTNTLAVLAGALWAARNKVPHIWHVREIIDRPKVVSSCFRHLVAGLADRVICNSDETRRWIAPDRAARTVTIWNGTESLPDEVRLPEARAKARARLALPTGVPVILVVGRINARKGQDLVVDAVELIRPEHQAPFRLLFVGGGVPQESGALDTLKARIASSAHASRIEIHPFAEEIADYYLAADILVLPSRHPESFGRVAIEAMSYGLPVIAAAHGGALEIIEEGSTGLFFRPNSAKALSVELTALLRDAELRQRMGEAGRDRHRESFHLEAYVAKVQAELVSAIEGSLSFL